MTTFISVTSKHVVVRPFLAFPHAQAGEDDVFEDVDDAVSDSSREEIDAVYDRDKLEVSVLEVSLLDIYFSD
jgi:predicted methyltransferase